MSKRTIWWIILCMGSFSAGYWLNELSVRERIRVESSRHVAGALRFAVESGMMTINAERMRKVESTQTVSRTAPQNP